jgi:thiol-disulfide isomerase/thioredoxin
MAAIGVVLVVGATFGWWRRRTDGRLTTRRPRASAADSQRLHVSRPTGPAPDGGSVLGDGSVLGGGSRLDDPVARNTAADSQARTGVRIDPALLARLGVEPNTVTLLQFSTAFCAPCRAVRRTSTEVAELLPDVRHVDIDAESHLDAVRALGIWRTPTLLVLDADGREVRRATGVPTKPQLIAAIGETAPAER